MSFQKSAVFGILLGAWVLLPSSASAADLDACHGSSLAIAQCECNIALSIGTPKALKSFMRNYSAKGTACAATASTAPAKPSRSRSNGESGGNGSSGGSGGSGGSSGGGGSSTGGGGGTHGSGGSGGGGSGGGGGNTPTPPSPPSPPSNGTDSPPDGSGNAPKGT